MSGSLHPSYTGTWPPKPATSIVYRAFSTI